MLNVTPSEQLIDLSKVMASFVELEPGNQWVVRFIVKKPFHTGDNQYTKQQIINALAKALKNRDWWNGLLMAHPELSVHFSSPMTSAERSKTYSGPPIEDWPIWGVDRAAIVSELARITPFRG